MIEITARLIRDQSAVFLCGETVECLITFTNPSLPEHRISQSNSDILENLAWATVQIHCYCNSTVQDRGGSGTEATSTMSKNVIGSTSLNASNQLKGEVLKSTDPKILFCDLRLSPGESRQFMFRETLSMKTPPTYRGVMVKYYYKITVATQRVGTTVQALHIPIRVLPLPPINCSDETITLNDESNEDLAPNNPFIEKKKAPSKIEYALHYLQNITARRRPNFYLISNKRGKVGRFCLFKPIYKLGEDIVGTLDFSCGTVKCAQLSVTLQCEEIIKTKKCEGTRTVHRSGSREGQCFPFGWAHYELYEAPRGMPGTAANANDIAHSAARYSHIRNGPGGCEVASAFPVRDQHQRRTEHGSRQGNSGVASAHRYFHRNYDMEPAGYAVPHGPSADSASQRNIYVEH